VLGRECSRQRRKASYAPWSSVFRTVFGQVCLWGPLLWHGGLILQTYLADQGHCNLHPLSRHYALQTPKAHVPYLWCQSTGNSGSQNHQSLSEESGKGVQLASIISENRFRVTARTGTAPLTRWRNRCYEMSLLLPRACFPSHRFRYDHNAQYRATMRRCPITYGKELKVLLIGTVRSELTRFGLADCVEKASWSSQVTKPLPLVAVILPLGMLH
jgi:hypothetical protein